MKVLIPILIGLLVAGCEENNQSAKEPPKASPSDGEEDNSTKAVGKKLTVEEKVVGIYEMNGKRVELLENGRIKAAHLSNVRNEEITWNTTGKEVHIDDKSFGGVVHKIEANGDLTEIAKIEDGKRTEFSKEEQVTIKKIQYDAAAENKKHNVVGTYVAKIEEDAVLELTLNNRNASTWKIVGREVHHGAVMFDSKTRRLEELSTKVYRIEANGDLTEVAKIEDGERTDLPKKDQVTFKKIK